MNTIRARGRPSRPGRVTARRVSAGLAACCLLTSVPLGAQEPIAAVWQPRKISFSYDSATTIFTCSALAGRVASILRAVGGRDDLKVKVTGCSESPIATTVPVSDRGSVGVSTSMPDPMSARTSPSREFVNVHVQVMWPTAVTPEVLAELEKDKSRRELVSRVTGNPAARFNDPVRFAAQWQPVTLSRKTIGIEPEECELLDQMSRAVFRKVGVRVISGRMACSPNSRLPPELVVEALMPAPAPEISLPSPGASQENAGTPAAGGDDEATEPEGEQTPE